MWRVKLSVVVLTILASAFLGACAETPDAKRARHLSRGDEYFGQGRYKDALIEYQNVLRFNASDSRAIERMGFAYHNLGDVRRAHPFLLKARQANPDHTWVQAHLLLANLYRAKGDRDAALGELKTAVAIEPVVGGARLDLVDFHAANRDFNAAKEVLRSSKESEGDYLATRRRLSE